MFVKVRVDFETAMKLAVRAAYCPSPNRGDDYWGHDSWLTHKDRPEVIIREATSHLLVARLLAEPGIYELHGSVLSSEIKIHHVSFEGKEGDQWAVVFEGKRGSIRKNWLRGETISHNVVRRETSEPDWHWWETRAEALSRIARERATKRVLELCPPAPAFSVDPARETRMQMLKVIKDGWVDIEALDVGPETPERSVPDRRKFDEEVIIQKTNELYEKALAHKNGCQAKQLLLGKRSRDKRGVILWRK